MADEPKGLLEIVRDLVAQAPDLVLAGGLAAWAYGNDRLTEDIDLVPSLDRPAWTRTLGVLREIGFDPADELGWRHLADPLKVRRFLEIHDDRVHVRFRHAASGIVLDLLVALADRYPGYAARASTAQIAGHDVKVISLEDLIDMKREAARNPHREKDRLDLETLEAILRRRAGP